VAYIEYLAEDEIPGEDRVPDDDNILRIHGVRSRMMRRHFDLYRELMFGVSPLSRVQREMIAVVVSAANDCHY
jgi:alkylhydroperoxidase family enzyme